MVEQKVNVLERVAQLECDLLELTMLFESFKSQGRAELQMFATILQNGKHSSTTHQG